MPHINFNIVADDLLSMKAGACICNIHRSKDLSKGILSRKIANAAGPNLQSELNLKEHAIDHGQVLEANPGRLSSKFCNLYFVCLRTWQEGNDEGLQGAIEGILNDAGLKGLTTVALPPLGTGGLGYPPRKVAFSMLQAVMVYSIDNPESPVTTVNLSLFNQREEMIQAFTEILIVGVELFESCNQEQSTEDNARPQGDQNSNRAQAQDKSSIFASLVSGPRQKNLWDTISSYFFKPIPVYTFNVGPASVGVRPHLNVRRRGLGAEATIGVTFSIAALPDVVQRIFSKLLNRSQ